MLRPFSLALRVMLFALLVFGCLRLGYYLTYSEYFAPLTGQGLRQAFLVGVKFDVSITVSLLAPLLLLLVWPWARLQTPRVQKALLWLMFAVMVVLWSLSLADLAYFGEVYRHIDREVLVLGQDLGGIIEFAIGPFKRYTFIALAACALLALLWQKTIIQAVPNAAPYQPAHTWGQRFSRLLLLLLFVCLIVIGIRGFQLTGKNIKTIDAFSHGDERQAALSLNGAFNMVNTLRRTLQGKLDGKEQLDFFQPDELEHWLATAPALSGPLSYAVTGSQAQPKNVVLIAVESLSFKYVDALSGQRRGITPYLDELLTKSRYWTHFYASGQRSIEGIQSILTSVPLLESQPYLGWGLELNNIPRVATLLNQRGYQTTMMQASDRRSFNMDGIARSVGFQHYFGREDYPMLRDYPQYSSWGWDYETLMFLAEHLKTQQQAEAAPFFAFLFTGSTHNPFPDPGAEFHRYPHEEGTEAAYFNTVRYFDWSLQQFMDWAATQDWYHNTAFLITADHVLSATADGDLENAFHIPFIVYTPDGSVPPGKDERYASHHDILPTLLTLTQEPTPINTFGRSLLDTNPAYAEAGALIKRGDVSGWVGPKGWFTFTSHQDLEQGGQYQSLGPAYKQKSNQVKARLQRAEQQILRPNVLP